MADARSCLLPAAKRNEAEERQGIESVPAIDWTEESLQVCDWLLIKNHAQCMKRQRFDWSRKPRVSSIMRYLKQVQF